MNDSDYYLASSQQYNPPMRGFSLRAIAGGAAARAKEISQKVARGLTPQDPQQGDGGASLSRTQSGLQWARQRISAVGRGGAQDNVLGVESVHIFPGWAARRSNPEDSLKSDAPFDIEIAVSGYASSLRPPHLATRSQRVFMQLARRYAALPKLPVEDAAEKFSSNLRHSKSTEDLLRLHPLPPTPSEMTEERETALLEEQFRKAEDDLEQGHLSDAGDSPPGTPILPPQPSRPISMPIDSLKKLHQNLDMRLQPFWSSIVANRMVRVSVFASEPQSKQKHHDAKLIDFGQDDSSTDNVPIAIHEVFTSPRGSYQTTLRIPWESICTHPKALGIAFGDRRHDQEHPLWVTAELTASGSENEASEPVATSQTTVNLTSAPLRVISDVDDTIKVSDILAGAKTVFHNVFVRELEELVIHNMADWYQQLWDRGVRFHYVSNSPFELLQVMNQFINISRLPQGSVKLRSYGGKSLISGLMSSPAVRKRSNVLEVLTSFPDSQFILIGDSGEQDLELYAALAADRSPQILGIFIRDVSTAGEKLTDPTGERWLQGYRDDVLFLVDNPHYMPSRQSNSSNEHAQALSYEPRRSSTASSSVSSSSPQSSRPSTSKGSARPKDPYAATSMPGMLIDPSPRETEEPDQLSASSEHNQVPGGLSRTSADTIQRLPLPTRRRLELQIRVNRVRDIIPSHVKFRVFQDASECAGETDTILTNLHL